MITITVFGLKGGSRAVLHVESTITLAQVLSQACTKLSIPSTHGIGLKYNKKILDLSLPLRLTSLPNGAKLEMAVMSGNTSKSLVLVALRLVKGSRLILNNVSPTSSLWQILCHFEKDSKGYSLFGSL